MQSSEQSANLPTWPKDRASESWDSNSGHGLAMSENILQKVAPLQSSYVMEVAAIPAFQPDHIHHF